LDFTFDFSVTLNLFQGLSFDLPESKMLKQDQHDDTEMSACPLPTATQLCNYVRVKHSVAPTQAGAKVLFDIATAITPPPVSNAPRAVRGQP
jgi:hypothetical protein